MKARNVFLIALMIVFACGGAAAQGTTGGVFVSTGMARQPYSADTITITDRTLADGNHIHRETHGKIYRDSQGRTRSETEMPVPPGGEPFTIITINDPVQRVLIRLDKRVQTAQLTHLPDPQKLATERAPMLAANKAAGRVVAVENKNEDLGTQDIEGVLAHGTRMTRTIPPGAEGNDQPIIVVSEHWMAQDLGATVLTKNTDPRNGSSEHRLSNIQRGEPDPALFQIPADYKVTDNGTLP